MTQLDSISLVFQIPSEHAGFYLRRLENGPKNEFIITNGTSETTKRITTMMMTSATANIVTNELDGYLQYFVDYELRSSIMEDDEFYDLWPVTFGVPSGGEGTLIAEFSSEEDAFEYSDWKNRKEGYPDFEFDLSELETEAETEIEGITTDVE